MANGIDKDNYNNDSNFGTGMPYILWLTIYMVIALAISFLVPFPISIIAFLSILIPLQVYRIRRIRKRLDYNVKETTRQSQPKDDSLSKISNSISDKLFGSPSPIHADTSIKFYCLSCGMQHKERACPRCGSKAVRT